MNSRFYKEIFIMLLPHWILSYLLLTYVMQIIFKLIYITFHWYECITINTQKLRNIIRFLLEFISGVFVVSGVHVNKETELRIFCR